MRRWLVGLRAASMVLLIMIVAGAVPSQRLEALAQGGGTIGYGSKVLGMISADLTQVIYSFNGATGDLVQVHVKSWVGTLDAQVTLLGPDGQAVADSARSPFAVENRDVHLARFLPQTGTYLLLVSTENGTTGQFLLTLQGRAPVPATTLVYGEAVDVTVPQNPQPQYYVFDALDCPTTLTVTNLSLGQPFTFPYVVKVRNGQGGLIALLYGGDAVEDRLVVPPLSGRYEVEVLSEDPQQQGTVNLLVTCSDAAPGCIDGGADTVACPPCIDETFGGELCADFTVTATDEGGGAFSFAWPAVEGAEWYIFVILDAWGALVADSPVLLEGDASHAYTFNPADLVRGPFTVDVRAGRGRDVAELLCVGRTTFTFEGVPAEACGIDVSVAVVPGDERWVVASWTAAPGAAAYTIHVYAYGDDGGLIGIRVLTVPGEHITYHLEGVFPADYARFQIGVRAYSEATGGGAFGDMPQGYLCGGETDVEFPKPGPVEWGPPAGS